MRVLRDHGMSKDKRYWHDVVGYNYRMTNLQAAIGLAQVERIEIIHENRRKYENSYKDILNSNAFIFQKDIENRQRITWLVSILIYEKTDREDYLSKLQERGIDARPFFYPLSDMDIYKQYCKKDTLVTSAISKSGINLPAYESLNNMKKIQYILNKHFNNA
jgi:perosamine synthetase